MLGPICVKCRLHMRCIENDRCVNDREVEGFSSTYWWGDEWKCPECGCRVATGFGRPMRANPSPELGEESLCFDYERQGAMASQGGD